MSSSKSNAPLSSVGLAYLVLLAGVSSALHIWKLPPAIPALQKEVGLSLVESGFLLSLVQMGGMTLGLLVGLVAQKIGLRRCVIIGLALLSISSACGALVATKGALLLFRALEGCGFLMVVMPGPALIKRLVPADQLNRIMGVWGTYIPTATVIALLGGSWVLSMSNWEVLWWVMAVVTTAVMVLVYRVIPADPSRSHSGLDTGWSIVKTTLLSENAWLVGAIFGFYAAQWIAIIGFLPTIYALAGISGTTAGVMTAAVAGANAIGTWAAGRMLHQGFRPPGLMMTAFVTMIAAAIVAFGFPSPPWLQFISVFMLSLVGGLIPTTLFVLAIRLAPSPQTTPTTIGLMQQLSSLGQFAGPPVVAWVVTLTGGWQWTWVATSGSAILGMLCVWRLASKNNLATGNEPS